MTTHHILQVRQAALTLTTLFIAVTAATGSLGSVELLVGNGVWFG